MPMVRDAWGSCLRFSSIIWDYMPLPAVLDRGQHRVYLPFRGFWDYMALLRGCIIYTDSTQTARMGTMEGGSVYGSFV